MNIMNERIAKRMARAGLCSRREAERLILEGHVFVNGEKILSPALNVSEADAIVVKGKPLEEKIPPRLFRYHKPAGLVTTARDPQGRPTVFQHLPPEIGRVISVGRLDMSSEGLLLLTNDGGLARYMELPSTGWIRRYRVRVYGPVDGEKLSNLANGITLEGVRYGSMIVTIDSQKGSNSWLSVAITEGKNREIRKIMQALGLTVNRLIRVSYGPFQLGTLPKGAVEEIPARVIRDQLGKALPPKSS